MMIDQLIVLYKPNKKVKSEKKMDHLISQTHNDLATMTGTTFGAGK